MMIIRASTNRKWLPLYEALASDVRLNILDLLAERELNIKDLAACLKLSPAIVTMHIRKLERAGLIATRHVRKNRGTHKLCCLIEHAISIDIPARDESLLVREQSIPVGHYTAFNVHPTCGLATREKLIGLYDDPRYFLDPERVNAAILWFGSGFVEYKTPNYLLSGESAKYVEISLEVASEAPGVRDIWPSDIRFYFNSVLLGTWTSPGDFGKERRGKYTPDWWSSHVNQYGLWKTIRIDDEGTFIDGERMSDTTLTDIQLEGDFWTLRFAVEPDAKHVGGLTLYGSGFGNTNKDIQLRVAYVES